MKWTTAVAVGALAGAVALFAGAWPDQAAKAEGEGPAIRVEKSRVDLGTVRAGRDAVAVFTLHNPGDVPVKILKAKPS